MGDVAKLVSAKCPHCGAPVQLPAAGEHLTCQYCNNSSFIQRDHKVAPPPSEAVIVVRPSGMPFPPILFAVGLSVDDGTSKTESVTSLDAGKEREVRFDGVRLTRGDHTLTATADATKAVAESDEGNNDRAVSATCRADK